MTKNLNEENIKQIPASQLRSEEEIIASWKGDVSKPLVSINCITYNHAPYIEDALIGFLRQETDFPIEILIHDDASTDGTADIIRKYERLYPNLIKPIYQVENQYSKGVRPFLKNSERAKGKYIALCEGDDYWVDLSKLQSQFRLCKESNYSVIFHSAIELNLKKGELKTVSRALEQNGKVKLSDSVKGRGAFMPTASLFFPRKLIVDKIDWFDNNFPIGDFFLQIILSYSGEIFYMDKPMCVYRRNSIGSWTESQESFQKVHKYHYNMLKGILVLCHRLNSSGFSRTNLLAYPYFFYATAYAFGKKQKIVGLFKLLSLVPIRNVPISFTALYVCKLFKFPFSILLKKINLK